LESGDLTLKTTQRAEVRFFIEVGGHTLVVVIHKNRKSLVRAAYRYEAELDWSDASACFQQSNDESCTGIIRMSLEDLSLGVLAHEVVHAAAHISRIEESRNPDLSWSYDISDEEDFADLVEAIMDAAAPELLKVLTSDK
jgi:hypothetical protein